MHAHRSQAPPAQQHLVPFFVCCPATALTMGWACIPLLSRSLSVCESCVRARTHTLGYFLFLTPPSPPSLSALPRPLLSLLPLSRGFLSPSFHLLLSSPRSPFCMMYDVLLLPRPSSPFLSRSLPSPLHAALTLTHSLARSLLAPRSSVSPSKRLPSARSLTLCNSYSLSATSRSPIAAAHNRGLVRKPQAQKHSAER